MKENERSTPQDNDEVKDESKINNNMKTQKQDKNKIKDLKIKWKQQSKGQKTNFT